VPDPNNRLNAALEGRYRIERELGAGGMATVYLAADLRHERKVALKVLKPELAAIVGADRFLAEIRTTANLHHPHILPLHDSGEADGFLFYVMPYVEGESLRERLDREKQLPIEEAVRTATNVAEALQYAHERGVIHRDIKPANILLQAGKPVIADFGIALAVGAAGGGRLTETGLSLGTPHYMSPEQASGDLHVGPASDIYALGCVLYEMLVGEPPFTGSTTQAIIGKIITSEAPSAVGARRAVPANVDAVARKALEKLPADRFPDAQHFLTALGDPGFRHELPTAGRAGRAPGPWNRVSIVATGLALMSTAVAGWYAFRPTTPSPVTRYSISLPAGQEPSDERATLALSPDGSALVYAASDGTGRRRLWVKRRDELRPQPLAGTEGGFFPTFSPDGQRVAFFVREPTVLKVVSLEGGSPITLVDSNLEVGGLAWGRDGFIYFDTFDGLSRVSSAGSRRTIQPFVAFDRSGGEISYNNPQELPNEAGFIFTVFRGSAEGAVVAWNQETETYTEVVDAVFARYVRSGHLIYGTGDGTVMAQAFDPDQLTLMGEPFILLQDVAVGAAGAHDLAISDEGTLVYRPAPAGRGRDGRLVWVTREGAEQPIDSTWTGSFTGPALSPDGSRLAVELDGPASNDIWIKRLDHGQTLRLSVQGTSNSGAAWTPDGASVTFSSNREGTSGDLWTRRADASVAASMTQGDERALRNPVWSPGGEWLVYATVYWEVGQGDIFAVRPGTDDAPIAMIATEFREATPALSPDGRWLAYTSNESGRLEVYVAPFPDAAQGKWPVSEGGGSEPVWGPDGRELFYRNGANRLVSVAVQTSPGFAAQEQTILFPTTAYHSAPLGGAQYDVSPEGERFVMIRQPAGEGELGGDLVVVENLFEELKRLAPR
jgi:serine/threonine-protein kinase